MKRCCSKLTPLCYNISLRRIGKPTALIADNFIIIMVQTLAPQLKRIKPIPFQKQNQSSCILKVTTVQHEITFSAVLYKNNVTDRPTSFFYIGKHSALFCCPGRIEIKYLFLWLLQNNLLGVEMLFEILKYRLTPRFFYFQQHFSISEVIPQQIQNFCFVSEINNGR